MTGGAFSAKFEAGEDNYVGGWGGIRYALWEALPQNLKERDRQSSVQVRIPRNIASVTQCGDLDVPRSATFWRSEMTNLCSDEDEINKRSTRGITKN